MTLKQKFILLLTVFVLTAMLFFPPYHTELQGFHPNKGYHFILLPPSLKEGGYGPPYCRMDCAVLTIQYVYVVTIGSLLWILFMPRRKNRQLKILNSEEKE